MSYENSPSSSMVKSIRTLSRRCQIQLLFWHLSFSLSKIVRLSTQNVCTKLMKTCKLKNWTMHNQLMKNTVLNILMLLWVYKVIFVKLLFSKLNVHSVKEEKKKSNTPINFAANYRREMKLTPVIIVYINFML